MTYFPYVVGLCLLPLALGQTAPTVNLPGGSKVTGSSAQNVDSFTGIRFAEPPTGSLRLKAPQQLKSNPATINATGIPTGCPQFVTSTTTSSKMVSNYLYPGVSDLLSYGVLTLLLLSAETLPK